MLQPYGVVESNLDNSTKNQSDFKTQIIFKKTDIDINIYFMISYHLQKGIIYRNLIE
jgi:hypothetical protein